MNIPGFRLHLLKGGKLDKRFVSAGKLLGAPVSRGIRGQ